MGSAAQETVKFTPCGHIFFVSKLHSNEAPAIRKKKLPSAMILVVTITIVGYCSLNLV
jgi:hypothetical protein